MTSARAQRTQAVPRGRRNDPGAIVEYAYSIHDLRNMSSHILWSWSVAINFEVGSGWTNSAPANQIRFKYGQLASASDPLQIQTHPVASELG